MNGLRPILRATMLGAVVVALLGGCGAHGLTPPAAVVDGASITQADVHREVDVFLAVTPAARAQFEGPAPARRTEDLNRSALGFLIQQQLIEQYASQHGIAPEQQALTQGLQQTVTGAGGQVVVAKQLAARRLSEADVRAFVRQIALRQAVAASLSSAASQQDQAFSRWLLGELKAAHVDVNPRFGVLNVQSGQVDRITSTDQLS